MDSNMIKNIIFDLSEVLLTGIKDTGLALKEKHDLEKQISHEVDWAPHKTPLLIPLVHEFFHGNVTEDEYIKEVIQTYPQIGSEEWLKDHIRENFKEVEGTRDVIIKLKQFGYTLAILSIHAKEWIDYCNEKYNFHNLFDLLCYSYEEKVSKPHPQSFQNVLSKLNAKPEECLFIDDSKKNIEIAESLGIQSILFIDADGLRSELSKKLPNFKI